MRVKDMTDEQLKVERGKVANAPGKYAAKRWLRLLDEEIRRDANDIDNN